MSLEQDVTMTEEPLPFDKIHSLLSARHRRYTLYCLYLYTNPIYLPDVAGQIAEWKHGRPEDELLDERLDIYISLYHNHIPKLADAGVVSYSQDEDMVELGCNAQQIRPHLEQAAEKDLAPSDMSLA
ncbi:MAG: hypothetical protein ABEH86_09930 [Haloarcula sp.]